MRKAMNGEEGLNNPNQWADRKKTIELFGYDADKAVDEWWRERGARQIGSLGEVTGVAPFFLTGRGAGGGRKRLLHARSMFSMSFGEENSLDFWKQEGR